MLTVTVGHPELIDGLVDVLTSDQLAELRLVLWDLKRALPDDVPAADVEVVVIPNYSTGPDALGRLGGLPNLRVVQLPSAGFEHAVPYLPEGVALCNGRGVHDAGTAELAVALTLASQRGLDDAVRAMQEERWAPSPRSSLADRRVMVLGHGSIGSAVTRRLEAFEVDIVPVATTAREEGGRQVHGIDEVPQLLGAVDVVVVTLPLTASTEKLVDAGFLARMRDGALLVNVGRGKVVDTDALVAELRAGRLRAALDVTDPEPLPPGHPLWTAPGAILTPHVGGYTDATTPRLVALLARQLAALLDGQEPGNVVRPGTGAITPG